MPHTQVLLTAAGLLCSEYMYVYMLYIWADVLHAGVKECTALKERTNKQNNVKQRKNVKNDQNLFMYVQMYYIVVYKNAGRRREGKIWSIKM